MVAFFLNGAALDFAVPDAMPLVHAVRDEANLTGTKYACGSGDCGACMVDIDGDAMLSCAITVGECAGRSVTTIEGLAPDRTHALQTAFVAEQVAACGYCTPGMIMAASALLRTNPAPDDAAINAAIANLCRCGTYGRVRRAIARAARILAGEDPGIVVPPDHVSDDAARAAAPSLSPTISPADGAGQADGTLTD